MRVLILGIDGYLGWSLAQYLAHHGHQIGGMDNFARRRMVQGIGGDTVIEIASMMDRVAYFEETFGQALYFYNSNLAHFTAKNIDAFGPDCIVHFAEQPSAPWSMRNVGSAVDTQINNVEGTLRLLFAMRDICPEAHLLKLGTMGEYGTPGIPIEEGFFEWPGETALGEWMDRGEPLVKLPFPRQPGSFYHASKVFDSVNIDLACRIWGLRATDIMQGVVYGTRYLDDLSRQVDPRSNTRFDVDADFGTCINRFVAQAVAGQPLTVYGKGGQTRGYLPLCDSMQCLRLALENPPEAGEYRIFNQIEETYSVNALAEAVRHVSPLPVQIDHIENPRVEAEEHFYEVKADHLRDLGYQSRHTMDRVLETMFQDVIACEDRIDLNALIPSVRWSGKHAPCVPLETQEEAA